MLFFVSFNLVQESKMLLILLIFLEQRTIPEAQHGQDVCSMCSLSSPISSACLLGFLLGTAVLPECLYTFTPLKKKKKVLVRDDHAGLTRTGSG